MADRNATYEYQLVMASSIDELPDILDKHGEKGWRVVQVLPATEGRNNSTHEWEYELPVLMEARTDRDA